jgi:protocatechuate 4,5-dioxygenase alpha chain
MAHAPQPGKFDPAFAAKGYALNKLCHSLNHAANRAEFSTDEARYCARFGLSEEERAAVLGRDKPRLYATGGNMYFLAKLDRVKKV